MAVEVTMPKLGLTMTEGVLVRWLVADGAEVKQRMILSLTLDHRLIDGAPAARFLARVRELIENPGFWQGGRGVRE